MDNSQGSQTEGQGAKYRGFSHNMLLKEVELKSSSKLKHYKVNRQPCQRKTPQVVKGKTLTIGSKLEVAEVGGVDVDEGVEWVRTKRADHKSM